MGSFIWYYILDVRFLVHVSLRLNSLYDMNFTSFHLWLDNTVTSVAVFVD
jgi:hypothetical protein